MLQDQSPGQLYGGSISTVSGLYALYQSMAGTAAMIDMWGMTGMGLIVLVHGLLLFTSVAARIGRWNGPLMMLYAAIMLGNQFLLASMLDVGMVAIAALMGISGLIMYGRRDEMDDTDTNMDTH